MKSPKLLSWLANQAGIPLRRAEVLWHAAERHAAHVTGVTGVTDSTVTSAATAAYWAAAMERLHELMATESQREDAASFGWRGWTRVNKRIWQAPLAILDALALNGVRGWRLMRPIQFG